MKKTVNQVLCQVFGIVLVVVAIGALIGGVFAHNYVSNQLKQENIAMPMEKSVTGLPKDSQDALKPYFGKMMTTGTQAQAYANHYIWDHVKEACTNVKDAQGNAVPAVPDDKCTYAGIGDFSKAASGASAKAAYSALRNTAFQGDALRSMLLTAYAFWLLGSIAIVVAIVAFILGACLLVLGYAVLNKPASTPATE